MVLMFEIQETLTIAGRPLRQEAGMASIHVLYPIQPHESEQRKSLMDH